MSLQYAYHALRRDEMSGCRQGRNSPKQQGKHHCIFSEERSHHSFNYYMTLMTGFSHCLSSLQNFLLPSPHLHLPYWLWRFHLQLVTAVLSIWKTAPAKPKVSCGATVPSKLLLTSFMFLTSSLGFFLGATGSPSSHKRSHRASLAVQGTPQQGLFEFDAVTSLVFMSWKKASKYRQWWHRTLPACDSQILGNILTYCTKRQKPISILWPNAFLCVCEHI